MDEESLPPAKKQKTGVIQMFPVLPDDLIKDVPLIKVYVGSILDKKNISKVIVCLNKNLPIPELTYLKRMKNGSRVLLWPVDEEIDELKLRKRLEEAGIEEGWLEKEFDIAEVAGFAPKCKRQVDVANKKWPCNFHPDKHIEKLVTNTLFNDQELKRHAEFMKACLDVLDFYKDEIKNVAIVVDPKIDCIIGIGVDKTGENPLKHAVMVAVDSVAITQNGGAWNDNNLENIQQSLKDYLRLKNSSLRFDYQELYDKKGILIGAEDGPYLCTNYYVYCLKEPCIMCAMALVHSRAKRVFYGVKNESNGGLGSLCKVHCVKDLNHHYEAFSGLLSDEITERINSLS